MTDLRTLFTDDVVAFRQMIYSYYEQHRRDLPWRRTSNSYDILISEIMLQQTQVERVREKYDLFLASYPDFASLAQAPMKELLTIWQGLGYNRRALALANLAQIVVSRHDGRLPRTFKDLISLPGIGRATAGAIAAFAFNEAVPFIETNIRRVFIHHFFHDHDSITDNEILPLVEQSMDRDDPRNWYYALMDYGAILKKDIGNPNRRSSHYRKQPPFLDSDRKVRGAIVRMLLSGSPLGAHCIAENLYVSQERIRRILLELLKEGFIREENGTYTI